MKLAFEVLDLENFKSALFELYGHEDDKPCISDVSVANSTS